MSIGVLTTLFSALVVSRLIFALLVDHGPWRRISMLPLKVKAIDRFFARRVDWLRYRHVFWGLSILYVSLGLFFVAYEGSALLDNEFRGGTQVTLQLTQDMKRQDVMDRVRQAAAGAADLKDELEGADVLPVDPKADGVTSDTFTIKTLATDQQAILEALMPKFEGLTVSEPAMAFEGSDATTLRDAPVYRVIEGNLGKDIGRAEYQNEIRSYVGGVAVVLENLQPRPTLETLQERLNTVRSEEEFSETLSRNREVLVLKGNEEAVESAAILVRDADTSFFDNDQRFNVEVAAKEWEIAMRGLTEASSPASVQNFSAAIAKTFRAQAIVAGVLSFLFIAIYIWVRYGAMNYALGAIVPLVHDVLTAIGMVALADFLFRWGPTESLARSIGLMPFKIDLAMVASFLTIIGYSLNDSIVVMDRIRENRGKLPYASREAVNSAVNQTLSRTVITGGGTLIALIMLYIYGGEGVRGFAYSLFIGVLVGTYSSIGLTAPFVWSRKGDKSQKSGPLSGRTVTTSTPPAPVAATPGT
jgi:SecD/SecF fusion protein